MRVVGLLAAMGLLVAPALADPAKQPSEKQPPKQPGEKRTVTLPDVVEEAVTPRDRSAAATDAPNPDPWADPWGTARRTETPGIDGKPAAGVVITPRAHADARPYAEGGMVMEPPDVNDPMVLELGTNQLKPRARRGPWLPRDLGRAFKAGADRFWDVVLPKL